MIVLRACQRAVLLPGLFLCVAAAAPGCAYGSPTGLNNMPTADVVPREVLVLQAFSELGKGRAPVWFAGLDGAAGPGLTLRADWVQVQGGEECVKSSGFIRSLSTRWLVEALASLPSEEGAETSCTVKLDWVVPLGDAR